VRCKLPSHITTSFAGMVHILNWLHISLTIQLLNETVFSSGRLTILSASVRFPRRFDFPWCNPNQLKEKYNHND
jgi:hypothetical protein